MPGDQRALTKIAAMGRIERKLAISFAQCEWMHSDVPHVVVLQMRLKHRTNRRPWLQSLDSREASGQHQAVIAGVCSYVDSNRIPRTGDYLKQLNDLRLVAPVKENIPVNMIGKR